MRDYHTSLGSFILTVREPREDDVGVEYDEDIGDYLMKKAPYHNVYAVIEFPDGRTILYDEGYIDWYGDGGDGPETVVPTLLYKALIND